MVDNTLTWYFSNLDHDEALGPNDPLLQYFEGNYEKFIAREMIQNSIDARVENGNPRPAVAVEFEHLKIPTSTIPGLNDLSESIESCLQRCKDKKDDKGISFFSKALLSIKGKSIAVLRVSDYNTNGLVGNDEGQEDGSWYKLVRAIGENRMTGAGGGSFGIGKGAPFAASLIHTVYYSTFNKNGERIFQGRARLITHERNGVKKRGSGFFGVNGYQSVRKTKLIPAMFIRENQGTDIYIIGYEPESSDWKAGIIKSVLDNFWMAVKLKDLIINFKDDGSSILIDADSLEKYLIDYSPNDAYPYYLATIKPDRQEIKSLSSLGSCELYVRQDPSLIDKKDVLLMRLPKMMVKKRQFRIMNDGFAGVMLCNDSEGNKLLRDMEPPTHNDWNPELSPNKVQGKKALGELYDWIKTILRDMANTSSGDPEEIPELDRFLPSEENSSGAGMAYDETNTWTGTGKDESPKEVNVEQPETESEVEDVIQKFNVIKKTSGNKSGGPQGRGGEGGGGNGEGSGENPGTALTRINTDGLKFRIIAQKDKNGSLEYHLLISPSLDQKGAINIIAVGDDNNYPVEIETAVPLDGAQQYETKGSTIKDITLEKGKIRKISFKLRHSRVRYALGIESYES